MNAAPKYFTAAQIALAIGKTVQAVRLRLAAVAAPGTVTVRGQRANGYTLESLPADLRGELEQIARVGAVDCHQLLNPPSQVWTAPVPWHSLAPVHQEKATRLCEALAPWLERQHTIPGPELMQNVGIAYRQLHGNELEASKLRYIIDRATKRDSGLHQFHRPELFLDDAAFNGPCGPALNPSFESPLSDLHQPMDDHIKRVANQAAPTADDVKHVFHAAFKHLEKIAVDQPSKGERRAAKNTLLVKLIRAIPGLYCPQNGSAAANPDKPLLGLRSVFNQKYTRWIAGGRKIEAIADLRAKKSGRTPYTHAPCEKIILREAAGLRGDRGKEGNVSLAINLLSEKKLICPDCIEHFKPSRLSAGARDRMTPNAIQVAYIMRGSKGVREIGPTFHCDLSDLEAGSQFVFDDLSTWKTQRPANS